MKSDSNEFIDFLKELASMIAGTFGDSCEVVLSDLDHPDSSILAIFNNSVTGRKVGDPLFPFAMERVRNSADGYYINYLVNKNRKLIKTSTVSGKIGKNNVAFCINYDCSELENIRASLERFLAMRKDTAGEGESTAFPPSATMEALNEALRLVQKPVRLLNKKDRLRIIAYLEERGIFQMQKSIQTAAQFLGVSRYTVYNYLNELRAEKDSV
ncbi:MAG: helix-turn-helix transcriptional regulator [Synergistaceae bacterium]|jgi:predicted transcriptional regulator YheO|nr:helix-turn-helix transcriptional regulator [Synergistaceae bacterium]